MDEATWKSIDYEEFKAAMRWQDGISVLLQKYIYGWILVASLVQNYGPDKLQCMQTAKGGESASHFTIPGCKVAGIAEDNMEGIFEQSEGDHTRWSLLPLMYTHEEMNLRSTIPGNYILSSTDVQRSGIPTECHQLETNFLGPNECIISRYPHDSETSR